MFTIGNHYTFIQNSNIYLLIMHTNKSRVSVIRFEGLYTKHANMHDCMKISSYIYFFTIFYWSRNSAWILFFVNTTFWIEKRRTLLQCSVKCFFFLSFLIFYFLYIYIYWIYTSEKATKNYLFVFALQLMFWWYFIEFCFLLSFSCHLQHLSFNDRLILI